MNRDTINRDWCLAARRLEKDNKLNNLISTSTRKAMKSSLQSLRATLLQHIHQIDRLLEETDFNDLSAQELIEIILLIDADGPETSDNSVISSIYGGDTSKGQWFINNTKETLNQEFLDYDLRDLHLGEID